MPLNDASAIIVGTAISGALTGLSEADKNDPAKIWQEVMKKIYAALKTDAVVNGSGTTVVASGSSAGPWPATITGTLS
jgi:hypothetical protein